MPRVSVVMNCYNGARYLREAIDSVYCQTFADWEIVFWDDQSTDASGAIARSYDRRLHYYLSDARRRLGASRNEAIARADGEYLAFLDVDDVWLPDKLECELRLLARPETGMVYSNCYFIGPSGKRLGRYFDRYRPYRGSVWEGFVRTNPAVMSTVVVRRSLVEAVGRFDSTLTITEDYDLWLRIARVCEVEFDPNPLAAYRVHSGNASRNFRQLFTEVTYIYRRNLGANDGAAGVTQGWLRRALCFVSWRWAVGEVRDAGDWRGALRHFKEGCVWAGGMANCIANLLQFVTERALRIWPEWRFRRRLASAG